MRHDPADPRWPDRDRFVLSAGHACILQYAALHLSGYDLTVDDLKQFRQWGSSTPGPSRVRGTRPGVETTTGPLGQGIGNAVGMALAERMLAARYNRPGHEIVDHRTYAICSDGDLMEGVSGEASSIAGHLGLGRLIAIYDDNHITIEGDTALAFTEDVGGRYAAYGWHVQRFDDTWTLDDLRAALDAAHADPRPSMIILRTHIAPGAPNEAGHAPRPTARRSARRRSAARSGPTAGPRTRTSWSRTTSREHMDRRAAGAGAVDAPGTSASPPTATPIPTSRPSSSACSPAGCPRAGSAACPTFAPGRRAWPPARRAPRCCNALAAGRAGARRRLGRPRAVDQHH